MPVSTSRAEIDREHWEACDRVASRFSARWLRHYVAAKLLTDPVYPTAYDCLRNSEFPILDVGCGVGLLGFYLRERGCTQSFTGLDRDERKIRIAAGIANRYEALDLLEGDAQGVIPEFEGNVVLFDVLHYLRPTSQRQLLRSLADCIAPAGMLLLRDCPREPKPRYWATLWAEEFAQLISWNRGDGLHFPSRASLNEALDASRFSQKSEPLWGRTPFNNHLFIFRRHASEVVPQSG